MEKKKYDKTYLNLIEKINDIAKKEEYRVQ